jgi:hypothetical protein
MMIAALRCSLAYVLLVPAAIAQRVDGSPEASEQKTARGMKITTGITWDSPHEDDNEVGAPVHSAASPVNHAQ